MSDKWASGSAWPNKTKFSLPSGIVLEGIELHWPEYNPFCRYESSRCDLLQQDDAKPELSHWFTRSLVKRTLRIKKLKSFSTSKEFPRKINMKRL